MSWIRAPADVRMASCVISTPFGSPVVPDVKMIVQMSLKTPGVGSWGLDCPNSRNLAHSVMGTPVSAAACNHIFQFTTNQRWDHCDRASDSSAMLQGYML